MIRAFHPTLRCRRRGQALVEFAVVAIVLYLLLAAILTFGMLLYGAQTIQQAADFAARELARTPLQADIQANTEDEFYAIVLGKLKAENVYSEDSLAVDITDWDFDKESLFDFVERKQMPPVNQMLLPLMFMDTVENGAKTLLRYPGALVTSDTATSGYTVTIPIVRYAFSQDALDAADEAIVRWVRVLEVRRPPFDLSSDQRGLVSLRINYPYQSAVMTGYRIRGPELADPTPDDPLIPIEADDGISAPPTPGGGTLVAPDVPGDGMMGRNPYSGPYGLGRQAAWVREVRPFRRVLSAQAVARREIFER